MLGLEGQFIIWNGSGLISYDMELFVACTSYGDNNSTNIPLLPNNLQMNEMLALFLIARYSLKPLSSINDGL